MTLFESIILGIIQGIAEFLPISSSGHLAIFKKLFGLKDVGLTYDILLHAGTLVAVFIVYWKDILRLIIEGIGIIVDACRNIGRFFKKLSGNKQINYVKVLRTPYRKFVMFVIISTIPTGIIGVLFKDKIEAFATIKVVGIALIITAVCLFLVKNTKGNKSDDDITYLDALLIGLFQMCAPIYEGGRDSDARR